MTAMTTTLLTREPFENWVLRRTREDSALTSLRHRAYEDLIRRGFPSPKDEEWRFNDLGWFQLRGFPSLPESLSAPQELPSPYGSYRMVLSADAYPEHPRALPRGIEFSPLPDLLSSPPAWFKELWQAPLPSASPFTLLTQAYAVDGFVLRAESGVQLRDPVEFLVVHARGGVSLPVRNFIVVEPGARLVLLEIIRGQAENSFSLSSLTQVWVREGGELTYIVLLDAPGSYHIGETQFYLEGKSKLNAFSGLLSAEFGRRDLKLYLRGEGAEGYLSGLMIAGGKEELDFHTRVEHGAPSCKSDQYFKSVLLDRSHGIFDGMIYVHPSAQKTDALQTNKNILLSDQAMATANPHLEIYADDVRCTHGATVGYLSQEEEFYLRTRGIVRDEARRLLTYAFVSDLLERVELETLRADLEKKLFHRLVESGA